MPNKTKHLFFQDVDLTGNKIHNPSSLEKDNSKIDFGENNISMESSNSIKMSLKDNNNAEISVTKSGSNETKVTLKSEETKITEKLSVGTKMSVNDNAVNIENTQTTISGKLSVIKNNSAIINTNDSNNKSFVHVDDVTSKDSTSEAFFINCGEDGDIKISYDSNSKSLLFEKRIN